MAIANIETKQTTITNEDLEKPQIEHQIFRYEGADRGFSKRSPKEL